MTMFCNILIILSSILFVVVCVKNRLQEDFFPVARRHLDLYGVVERMPAGNVSKVRKLLKAKINQYDHSAKMYPF